MENIDFASLLSHGGTQDVLLVAALWLVKSLSGAIKDWIKNDIEEKVKSSMERQQIIATLEKIVDKLDDNQRREPIYPPQERAKINAKI